MLDSYVECLVKGKASGTAKFFKVILIILIAIFLVSMIVTGLVGLFLASLAGVGLYFVNLYTNIEYEYLYLDKEISVDKVLGRTKRKRAATYILDRIEVIAPVRSHHLDNYKNRKTTTVDYSSIEDIKSDMGYAMYYEGGIRVLFSPNEEMLQVLKNVAPRKVFTD